MATTPYLLQRGSTWSWRRRVPEFSTKTRHWQLSLRTTDRSIACIIARRLNYECDRMLDAISTGKLTPAQAKAWLSNVIRTELDRIERQRMVSRLDPVGTAEEDQRYDWATARAWRHLATTGLHPTLSEKARQSALSEGASPQELTTLETMLDLLSRDVMSEAGVNKMHRAARDCIQEATGESITPSTMMTLQLRQMLLAGKAAAWEAAEGREDPSLEQARALAFAMVNESDAPDAPTSPPETDRPDCAAPREPVRNATPPAPGPQTHKFTYDPNLIQLVERINDEKDRDHIKEDTRRQLASQARLFISTTGVTDVTDITQAHLKYYKSVLQRLPKSYGKSAKDADRSVEDLLARAADLPEDKVGLSPRTINGHLDRFSLIFRVARSESLKISDDIQLSLLRVPETKRNRDKREAFALPELQRVFRHPIWTGSSNHKRRHVPGKTVLKDGLYWGPLMAAYSGARREEVLALEPEDFTIVDEIPCCHIRNNAHRGVKTLSSVRLVPIHSHLIDLGFLRHVEEMRKRGAAAIFPELIPENESQSFGDKLHYNWSKAVGLQLEGNPRRLCFHSLRHYVITHLKQLPEVTDKQRRDLVGHSGKEVHDEQYDEATSMPIMRGVVEQLPRMF